MTLPVMTVAAGVLVYVVVLAWLGHAELASGGQSRASEFDASVAGQQAVAEPGHARASTAHGDAVVEMVISREEMAADESVVFHIVNRGDVPLRVELPFVVERWTDDGWEEVVPVQGDQTQSTLPRLGVQVRPGTPTRRQMWPQAQWGPPAPGPYRIIKTAVFEDPDDPDNDVELRVSRNFVVGE